MDWIDRLTDAVDTPLPEKQPIYWNNALIKHLELPDKWPIDWDKVELQEKAFVFFLEAFDPPANLQGLIHQLKPLRHVILELADNTKLSANDRNQLLFLLDQFIELTEDFISISSNDEKKVLKAKKLSDITKLGPWRFHFHCSQVDRSRIDEALNLTDEVKEGDKQAKVIRVAKLAYLREGPLEEVYQSIAADLHLLLRRRLKNKRKAQSIEPQELSGDESAEKKNHDIYTEVLACEHCIHLAHYLLKDGYKEKKLKNELIKVIRNLSNSKDMTGFVSDLPPIAATAVLKITSHIKSVHSLIASFGSYTKRNRTSKDTYSPRKKGHSGRLLPPGRYEEVIEARETTQKVQIDDPFNIFDGIFDEVCNEGLLHRRYGQRRKVSHEFGESEDDYKSSESISIPPSWLVDPYRNAIKQQVQMESLIIHQEPPVWSSPCLRVETIKQYLHSLLSAPGDVPLLASLAFYTGLPELSLKSIKLGLPMIFRTIDSTVDLEPTIYGLPPSQ